MLQSFDLVPLFHELGDIAFANEAYDVAVDSYQLILTYYPDHPDVSGLKYQTGFLLIEQLGRPLMLDYPFSKLQSKIIPTRRHHEKALFLIGKLQADMDQLENALSHLRQICYAVYSESEWIYEGHLIRAAVNLKLGRLEEAASGAIHVSEISEDENIRERAKQILDQTKWTVYTDVEWAPR